MIKADQPKLFNGEIIAAVSSKSDGQMQHGWVEPDKEVAANRQAFVTSVGLAIEQCALVRVQYADHASYDKIVEVSSADAGMGMYKKDGTVADCLVTTTKQLGLFLPVADCGATVVYDPVNRVLALAHLGRHSTVANLALKLVKYLQDAHNTNPPDLRVWISPSIAAKQYVLEYADFAEGKPDWKAFCTPTATGFAVDVAGYNKNQFVRAGVLEDLVGISEVDTATNPNYWSHHQQKNVRGEPAPPRFAVVAAL